MQRDSLDFKSMSVGKLFTKLLVPTIMGMAASALFTVVDGIFVGNGIGSDAMAAVNISAPIFMIITGVGLMFGMGGGILTSINLSQGKKKVANINFTQSVIALVFISLVMTLLLTIFPHKIATLFGSDEYLMDMVVEYLFWFSISLPFTVLVVALPFFIRLTNPKISMWAMLAATVVNIILDYLFIFVFKWGLFGAAIATDIGEFVGAAIMIVYLFRHSIAIRFVWLKLSVKSLLLTLRNVGYMIKLGFSVFLSEITISVMIISGNYVFMDYMGADGVAAYSVICYLFPIIFMVFNATVQSAQPIISYNYGCGQMKRSDNALRLSMLFTLAFAFSIMLLFICFTRSIVTLFIPDTACAAWGYAVAGLPLFATDYLFFGINIIIIGYYTSIERLRRAISLTVLRGILPVVFFFTLPLLLDVNGIWLAVAAGDITTTVVIVILLIVDKVRRNG
ncbi:MATE family efflux transporter [Parabacteroides segnis]|jgi:Na+-driven multidrug efflux pump|uniref:Multidrug export protein MepA n=1 Tax=Parabacteroides segnis TaxID=2763058 RepID=A0ABR7DYE8_9BACT|nr:MULTISPECIES: MATE family efflux transporter [Parabacteroides]MBC5641914.1 MATE family efflux transporter [Parabacteroides segnis]MCM0712289.1 MATE family efflux transporter [Parabacteroides sp. TA-V-105]